MGLRRYLGGWTMWLLVAILGGLLAACGGGDEEASTSIIGDEPALGMHTSQVAIDGGAMALEDLIERGEALFTASYNTLDGAGRPETTDVGLSNFRPRREFPDNFNRISGPDANTCIACHSVPRMGGGGDNVTNVFVDADRLGFANFDGAAGDAGMLHTLQDVGMERNAVGLFGSGMIEMLAREMTFDLHEIRDDAITEAQSTGGMVGRDLMTKSVDFGRITARPDGTLDTSEVEGVDEDLIIKPFHQKGVVVSLREFAVKAMNSHFGMQAAERFQDGVDADGDGVIDEVSRGDMTALVVFMATLPVPGQVMPADPVVREAAERGEQIFSRIECTACHVPALRLDNPVFTEPNPFNPPGKLQLADTSNPFAVDLTQEGPRPRLEREPDGSVMVPAFTDLKRHEMGDVLNNELMMQTSLASGESVPTDQWLTRKLWGVASEPPFLHHGRALLISEAILAHGGEARASQEAYIALPGSDQAAIVEFIKSLQVLPENAAGTMVSADELDSGEQEPKADIHKGALWGSIGGAIGFAILSAVVAFAVVARRRVDDSSSR